MWRWMEITLWPQGSFCRVIRYNLKTGLSGPGTIWKQGCQIQSESPSILFLLQCEALLVPIIKSIVANLTDSIGSKVDTAVEETAMVTDLREICEQFSDDNMKVNIVYKSLPCLNSAKKNSVRATTAFLLVVLLNNLLNLPPCSYAPTWLPPILCTSSLRHPKTFSMSSSAFFSVVALVNHCHHRTKKTPRHHVGVLTL